MAAAVLYLGTTPADLQSTRHDVSQLLQATGYAVREREPMPGGEASDENAHVRAVLSQCSGVILLVGVSHGPDAPSAASANTPPSSCTQLEHRLAQELGIPCYTYLLDEEFPYDDGAMESPSRQAAQCRFRAELQAQPRGWELVGTPERLLARLRLVTFRLEDLRLSGEKPAHLVPGASTTVAPAPAKVCAPPPPVTPIPLPGTGSTEHRSAPSPNLSVPPPLPAGFRQPLAHEPAPFAEAASTPPSRIEPHLPTETRTTPLRTETPPQKARFGLATALVLAVFGIAALAGAVVVVLKKDGQETSSPATTASPTAEAAPTKRAEPATANAPAPEVPASPQTEEPDPAKRPVPLKRTDGHALVDHDIITKLSWETARRTAPQQDVWISWDRRTLLTIAAQEHVDPEQLSNYESAVSYLRTANANESPLWKAYSARLDGYERDAIKYAKEAIEKGDERDAPDGSTPYLAWLIIGDAHMAKQEYANAVTAYRNAMSQYSPHQSPMLWYPAAERLGFALRHSGKWEEAENVLRESLQQRGDFSNSEDPRLTNALSDLAWVLHATNKPDEAQRLMQRALNIDSKMLGHDNPRTVERALQLAEMLDIATHRPEVESLYRRALASEEKVWGKDTAMPVPVLLRLALSLRGNDTAAEAESLCRKAIAICTREYGADAICVAEGYAALARVFYIQGNKAKSNDALTRASEALSSYLPAKTLGVADVDKDIGLLSAQSEGGMPDPTRAAEVKELVDVYLKIVGENHPATAEVLFVVARYHPHEAVRIYQRIVRIHTAVYGPDHPRVLKSLMELLSLMGSGTYPDAEKEPYIQAALANAQKRTPADPSDAGVTLVKLSDTLRECGYEGSVVPVLEKASAILEKRYGAYREVTLDSLVALRTALLSEGREREAQAIDTRLNEAAKLVGPDKVAALRASPGSAVIGRFEDRTTAPAFPPAGSATSTMDAATRKVMEGHMYEIVVRAAYITLPGESEVPAVALQDATIYIARTKGLDPKAFSQQIQSAAREVEDDPKAGGIPVIFAKVILHKFEDSLRELQAHKARYGTKAEHVMGYHLARGAVLAIIGEYPEAGASLRDAARMVQKSERPQLWSVITFMAGYCHAARDDWEGAARAYESVLTLGTGSGDEMIALVQRHLAHAEMHQPGKLKNAEALLRKALPEHRKHPALIGDLIWDLALLAEILGKDGRDEEALTCIDEAVKLQSEEFSPNHPNLARCLIIQSEILSNLELDKEAVPLLKEAIAVREHHFGVAHPSLMPPLLLLGVCERNAGLFEDSVAHLTRVVNLEDSSGMPPSSATVVLYNHLGVSLHQAGRLDEAEKRLRQTVALAESLPKSNLALVLEDLASLLFDRKELKEAETVLRRCVELSRKSLPKNHPALADRLTYLARALAEREKYKESATYLREAYAIYTAAHGADSLSVALCGHDFGLTLGVTGQVPEAEKVLRKSVAILASKAGSSKLLKPRLEAVVKTYEKILAQPEFTLSDEAIQSRVEKILGGQQVPELRVKRVP